MLAGDRVPDPKPRVARTVSTVVATCGVGGEPGAVRGYHYLAHASGVARVDNLLLPAGRQVPDSHRCVRTVAQPIVGGREPATTRGDGQLPDAMGVSSVDTTYQRAVWCIGRRPAVGEPSSTRGCRNCVGHTSQCGDSIEPARENVGHA